MSKDIFLLFVIFFFSSRRRHTRYWRDWSFRRVLFRSTTQGDPLAMGLYAVALCSSFVQPLITSLGVVSSTK